jgi:hypothetical protein
MGLGIFLFTTASRTALGPNQPPIQWVPGALSLGVKRLGREADYTSTPQYAFMAWCSVKAQGQLYLYLWFLPYRFQLFILIFTFDILLTYAVEKAELNKPVINPLVTCFAEVKDKCRSENFT